MMTILSPFLSMILNLYTVWAIVEAIVSTISLLYVRLLEKTLLQLTE